MTATATATHDAIEPQRIEEFAGRLIGIYADANTTLLISVGHRTGLFDTLEDRPHATSVEIAEAADLHERYVREWLGGMLVAGIIEHDSDRGTWWLPPEHAAMLTRSAGSNNLAKLANFVGLLAGVEKQVVTCFREGGGVPYSAYEEFHALMAEDSQDMAEAVLVPEVIPLVDGLADRLTAGIRVADVGCGSGHHLNVLARTYPASTFVGYDFSQEAIAAARAVATERGLDNVAFEARDVVDLSGTGPFDLVTAFDAIHDQAQPATVLSEIARSLAPDGVFLMVDIKASSHPHENVDIPWAPFLYTVSLFHCMTVSLALDGVGLGTVWGEQTAVRMLHEAGFANTRVEELEGDFFNYFYVATLA